MHLMSLRRDSWHLPCPGRRLPRDSRSNAPVPRLRGDASMTQGAMRMQRVLLAILLAIATPGTAMAAAPCGTDAAAMTAIGARLAAFANAAMAIVIAPSTLPDGTLDQPYQEALSATGGF